MVTLFADADIDVECKNISILDDISLMRSFIYSISPFEWEIKPEVKFIKTKHGCSHQECIKIYKNMRQNFIFFSDIGFIPNIKMEVLHYT